jgi:antitoxin VapB
MGAERHVKFFRKGESQAVDIPAEFEMAGDEAIMRKEGNRLVIEPIAATRSDLLEWLATIEPWDEDFPDLDLHEPPPRDVNL